MKGDFDGYDLGQIADTYPASGSRSHPGCPGRRGARGERERLGVRAAASGPVADTANGAVLGLANGAVDEFLGIPYAAPPVGALRWQPPQPAANWSGVRDATQFAPHCPQPAGAFGQASMTEDCLFLNVFAPSHHEAGSPHPVMVWIHGGALVSGENDD